MKQAKKAKAKKAVETVEEASMKQPVNEIEEASTKVQDEISALSENFNWEDIAGAISSLDFFVDHRSDECLEKGCENLRTTQQYCRLHYIANWYDIKRKRDILKEGMLQEYIEELISKYPPKLIESILTDLHDDKDFFKALSELNITSEFDFEEEDFDSDSDDEDITIETRSIGSNRFDEDN